MLNNYIKWGIAYYGLFKKSIRLSIGNNFYLIYPIETKMCKKEIIKTF